MTKLQQWARDKYKPGDPDQDEIDMWHPDIQAECKVMDAEYVAAQARADQARTKEVVESVANLEEQMKGKIVFFVRFKGSLAKTQKLTVEEAKLLRGDNAQVEDSVARKCKADKPLFGPFEAYEKLERRKTEWKERLKHFGVPFFAEGMTVIDIRLIPQVELVFDEIDRELPKLIELMLASYPEAIKPENVKLGPLYNARDYPSVEELSRIFFWKRKWMSSFDVPDILKEVDMARWEAERKRSAELWAEVRENGKALLRKQLAEMTTRLVDACKPDEKGEKKRFFATAVTNLTEFFEVFEDRNLAGDKDLSDEVAKLKALVAGKEIEEFKKDDGLRQRIATAGGEIARQLDSMLVSTSSRTIILED